MHLVFLHRFHEPVGGGIHSEINHFEAGSAQHHDAEILSDVMQIALDGAHHHFADRFDARGRKDRLNVGHTRLHGPRTGQHFRNENKVLSEFNAHDSHAGDQPVIHDLQRLSSFIQRFSGELVNGFIVAVEQRGCDLLHLRVCASKRFDRSLTLLRPLDVFLDFLPDKVIRNVA